MPRGPSNRHTGTSKRQRTSEPEVKAPELFLKLVEISELLELVVWLTDNSARWALGVLGRTSKRVQAAVRSLQSVYDLLVAREEPVLYGRGSWKPVLPPLALSSASSLQDLCLRRVGVRRDCAGLLTHLQGVERLTIFDAVNAGPLRSCQLRQAGLLQELRCNSADLISLRNSFGLGQGLRGLYLTSGFGAGAGQDNTLLVLKGPNLEETVPLCAWAPRLADLTLDFAGSPSLLPNLLTKLLAGSNLRRLSLLGGFQLWGGTLVLPASLDSLVLESRSSVIEVGFLDHLPGLRHLAIQVSGNRQYDWSWPRAAACAERLESLRLPCAPRDLPADWPNLRALGLARLTPASLAWLENLSAPRLTTLELSMVNQDQLPAIQPLISNLTELELEFCDNPHFIQSATQLRRLTLKFCQFGARLTLPRTLTELSLRHCSFGEHAPMVVDGLQLRRLEVRRCRGFTVCPEMSPPPSPRTDDVWSQLSRLAVAGLTALTVEQESVLQWSQVASVLATAHGLRELTITGPGQRGWPEFLARLQQLRFLSLPHSLLASPGALSTLRTLLPHCAELVLT